MKIIIDCGHGGIDKDGNYTTAPAKQAKVNGKWVFEGVLNRTIGGMLAHLLEWDGHKVVFTVHPNDSKDVALKERVKIANANSDGVLLSIHCNAFNGSARGFEIFTSKGQTSSDKAAQNIANEVEKVVTPYGMPLRFDYTDGDKDKEVDYYVLRKTKGTAVLVECLFFDNAEDMDLYNDKDFLTKFVSALYKGIITKI
jgi:N-acetylmuramoyl-L-alanine amidase